LGGENATTFVKGQNNTDSLVIPPDLLTGRQCQHGSNSVNGLQETIPQNRRTKNTKSIRDG
jgi:hypothetical protein